MKISDDASLSGVPQGLKKPSCLVLRAGDGMPLTVKDTAEFIRSRRTVVGNGAVINVNICF